MSERGYYDGVLAGLREARDIADGFGATKPGREAYASARVVSRIVRAIDRRIDPLAQLRAGELGLSGATRQPDGSVGG